MPSGLRPYVAICPRVSLLVAAGQSCIRLARMRHGAYRNRTFLAEWLRHLVNALAEFESLGIAFVSVSDNLDLSTASGRLMFNIIGAIPEFERELIRERVRAGMKNARAKGARIGRPRANVNASQIAHLRCSPRYMRTHPEDAAGIEKVLRFRQRVREEFDRLIREAREQSSYAETADSLAN